MAEQFASEFLAAQGYEILERNWRCRAGEIDIIAAKDAGLHFFEVKYRSSDRFGSAVEAIDSRKLHRLTRLAETYLSAPETARAYETSSIEAVCVKRVGGRLTAEIVPTD